MRWAVPTLSIQVTHGLYHAGGRELRRVVMSADWPNLPVWERGGWAPLPPLAGEVAADVCVVGLGGSGLSCVGELLRLGARVVGLEAGSVAGGAAGRNGGFLLAGTAAFHHEAVRALGRERAVAVYRLTLAELERIVAETPAAVRRVGSLRIAASEEERGDCIAQLAAMRDDGLPVEPYSGEEGEGLLFPRDAAFDPLVRARSLARAALAGGAALHERSPALSIAPGEVATPGGRVRCDKVVVAVDGGLERVVPELAGRVRTARLQMLATAPTDEIRIPRPVYYRWGYEYWQQLPDGSVALGGFRDRCGVPEWTHEAAATAPAQEMLERFLREHLRVSAPVTHRWAASISFSPGTLPVLEEVRPGVWAVGGYRGTGNVMGALCGRAAARLALEGASELAVAANG